MAGLLHTQVAVRTTKVNEFVDVTHLVADQVARSGVRVGLCKLFVPHTTAAVTLNENADPDVQTDLHAILRCVSPEGIPLRHAEGNSLAHFWSSVFGVTLDLTITGGRLFLGQWQGIYFCEFDGPRSRRLLVTIVEAEELPRLE